MVHYPARIPQWKMGTLVIKRWTWLAAIGRQWHLNHAQWVLRGPKHAKKISPTNLNHSCAVCGLSCLGLHTCVKCRAAQIYNVGILWVHHGGLSLLSVGCPH